MKKKFCLALLLITALCLSAAGVAQANPDWLAGEWKMGTGTGKFQVGEWPEEDVITSGSARLTISNVVVDNDTGTLTLSSTGGYMVLVEEEDNPAVNRM